ncbi:peptidyl-prolyl cis-trans isomerase [Pseudoalteromonas sp. SSDWG2]|uniref:peptidylprolyl isomerase n=1 Tax=Pseudoalteromonas sp. SSDWG2 TaxID=3139391 RepID=UPI003BAC460A
MHPIFRQPLLHFLCIGACILGAYVALSDSLSGEDENTIVINDERLAVYLQFRNKRFSPSQAKQLLAELDEQQLQLLIDDYITEEVLVKEANKLGLADNDFVIRQRLLQKMQFLNQGFVSDSQTLSEEQLNAYYQSHKFEYAKSAVMSFSHLFWSKEGDEKAQRQSLEKLRISLNNESATANDTTQLGELFVFNRHYISRSADHVAGHFGEQFVNTLKQQQPFTHNWIGPIQSAHGWHLVYVTDYQDAYVPSLDEVRPLVTQDAMAAASKARADALIDDIVAGYTIVGLGQSSAVEATQ